MTEVNDDVQACILAKRLAGMIRTLKEQIIDEMNIQQETNTENCQLQINIHRFQERLKELDVLYSNYETSNAEIERRKKRYSEQLAKISKLVSEQNFDAANWAIILDEMVFVNRELFEILMSTAIAERRALQMEIIEEEKYRFTAEKLVLKRTELRQELHSQMNSYELLRAQINQIESNLMNLQKTIDVYDAEYWQLDDARHDLRLQIFQLEQLLRQRHCCLNSSSKSPSSHNDNDDNDDSMNDKSLTVQRKKSNATIPYRKTPKKKNNNIANAKFKDQTMSKTVPETKQNASDKIATEERMKSKKNEIKVATQSKKKEMAMTNQASSSNLDIRSDFVWIKKIDPKKNQSASPDSTMSSNTSYFFVEHYKLQSGCKLLKKPQHEEQIHQKHEKNSNRSTSTEFKTTASQAVASEILKSYKANTTDSSKSSNLTISDDETTDLTSESISLSDKSPETINDKSPINSDIKDQKKELSHSHEIRKVVDNADCELYQSPQIKKLSSTSAIKSSPTYQSSSLSESSPKQQTGIRQPYCISRSGSISEISIDNRKRSKIKNGSDSKVKLPGKRLLQQQQQLMHQPCYNHFRHQVESHEQRSESLSFQNQNVEFWQEISEKTFLRDIAS